MHLLIVSPDILASHVFQNSLLRQNIRSLTCLPTSLNSDWVPQTDAIFFPHPLNSQDWHRLLPFLLNLSAKLPLLLNACHKSVFYEPIFKSFLKQSIFLDPTLDLEEFPLLVKDVIEKSTLKDQGRFVQLGAYILDRCQRSVFGPDTRAFLTPKEFFLLELLIQNSGRITTREHIINRVWDRREYVAPNTIEVYISRLRHKLGDSPLTAWIRTVPCLGYQFTIPIADLMAPSQSAARLSLEPSVSSSLFEASAALAPAL